MSQWVNGSVDGSMGRMGPGSMGQWVMGLGYDGSWVTNGDPWSTLVQSFITYENFLGGKRQTLPWELLGG